MYTDLSQLQIFTRDYEGFANSRREILMNKAGIVNNWVAFAMANYLRKDYKAALSSIDSILKFEGKAALKPHEKTAILTLQARCHMGMKDHKKAFRTLTKNKATILDDIEYHECVGDL